MDKVLSFVRAFWRRTRGALSHFSDSKPEERVSQEAGGGLGRSKGIIRIFEYSGMSRTSVYLKIVV